jgi:hypothetical protein
MLGNSKNGKHGLFGNLEKRSLQWSHNMLHVCRCFLMFYLSFKNTPKMLINLTRARSRVLDIQK